MSIHPTDLEIQRPMKPLPDPLPIDAFLHELEEIRAQAIHEILSGKWGRPPFSNGAETEAKKRPEVIFFLQLGVYPEWREVHFLSRQIQRLEDSNLVYRVAEQIHDEAKHAKVLRDQLLLWGSDPDKFWYEPIHTWAAGFDYMDKLMHPAEYFACSNYIGEGLFLPTIMRPMAQYDPEAFAVYVEHIMPDEARHIMIGRDIVAYYCRTYEMQERVRKCAKSLAKQYCIGFGAAVTFAYASKLGLDTEQLRDAPVHLVGVSDL